MNSRIKKNTADMNPLLLRGGRGSYLLCICCFILTLSNFVYANTLNDRYLHLQDQLTKDPNNLDLQMDLAFLFSQGLEFKRAVEIYERVTQSDAVNQRAWIELCALKTEMQDQAGATVACEMVVQLQAKAPWAHDNLGLMHFKFGQFEKSLKPFLRAISLDGNATLPVVHYAQALMAMNHHEVARDLLNQLLERKALTREDEELIHHTLYLAHQKLRDFPNSYKSIVQTWQISGSDIYLGKVIRAWMKYHELLSFAVLATIGLLFSQYFGKRINRFLKNEV